LNAMIEAASDTIPEVGGAWMGQDETPAGSSGPGPTPLRICIVAENASFQFGGEASLPLHYFSRLRARGIDACLIVHGRTQAEIEALFPGERERIHFIRDRWFHKLIWQASRLLPRRISEATCGTLMVLINQWMQRQIVRGLVRGRGIDVVHQPIPVSPRAPSFLFGLGAPVVMGPMNGGMEYPPAFRSAESRFTRVTVALARRGSNFINRLIPGKRAAEVLLVANRRTREALPPGLQGTIIEIPENGVDVELWSAPADRATARDPGKFIFIGRLVDWKRLDLAISAIASVPGAFLEVIGDGPMRSEWAELAARLGAGDRIVFSGWLPQSGCARRLRGSAALLLPSVYECGGAVVLEALAAGTPAIATAWGGPADYLDEASGILIAPESEGAIIEAFAVAMRKLMDNPEFAERLGRAGQRRVMEEFDWENKVDRLLGIYRLAYHEAVSR
jgi:glycosyltransferase involved in cell wall biosynthesis